MLASDQAIWQESISKTSVEHPFIDKDILYINDQNNGNYSGQIQFDCSSLANNQRWLNYQEAYLEVPFMINVKSTAADYSALVNSFSAAIKNGYYQLIDSMQVDLNNQNIVQLQNNLNMLVNYKLLTSFSQDDLNKLGPVLGFYPDSADSFTFSATAAAGGDGYANNRNAIVTTASPFTSRGLTNSGLLARQKATTGNNAAFVLPTTGSDAASASTIYNAEGRNYYNTDGATTTMVFTWVIVATLRLKDLCDFFDKVPLMKGANYRFTINYNSAKTTVTTTTGPTIVTTSHTQLSGHTNPIMLPSTAASNSNNGIAIAGSLDVITGVVSTSLTSGTKCPFTSCRLYVPAYKLDPDYELSLIQSVPVTNIKYFDYYTYTIDGVAKGQTFNNILTNGIVNPKALIVIPFQSVGVAASLNVLNLPTYQTLFDSAPATTTPNASITNFQVLLAGENVFNLNEVYTFSQFMDEFQHLFAVNGSIDTGINSGLISKSMWENAYRFYVANLSRRLRMEDKIPKSVQVQGTNNTDVTMSYICFILFEKDLNIKTSTGEILV
jgi:hypothetical protein